MSTLNQFTLLAEYNQLMNLRQYTAAAELSPADLSEDRGAFFRSVLGTLNHIMVGDIIWLQRFAKQSSSRAALSYIQKLEKPKSLDVILFTDLDKLWQARQKIDHVLIHWVASLTHDDINECISYINMAGKSFYKPFVSLINHLFLHQAHHRGQVTTLLSQFGVDFGDTDLIEIIEECST